MTKRVAHPQCVNMHTCLPMPERFWSKAGEPTESGCREWLGYRGRSGYGRFTGWPSTTLAHRIAWELANNDRVPDGFRVLHHCDNPPCVQTEGDERWPDGHLFIGTQADNVADMKAKERVATALTRAQVRQVKDRLACGARQVDLAREFGVGIWIIGCIARGKTWRHV